MYSSSSFQGLPANAQVGEGEGGSSRGASVTFPGSWQFHFTVCEGLRRCLCWSFGTYFCE